VAEVRTDVVAKFKTQGFAEAQAQAAKIGQETRKAAEQQVKGFDAVGKGAKAVDKELGRLQGRLKDLAKDQVAINQAMEAVGDEAAPAYQDLNEKLGKTQKAAQQVERVIRAVTRAFKEQTRASQEMQARGGFAQGLIQGAVPGLPFLQRGPGMRRQVVGMAAGRAIRGVAGGMVGAPFGGAQSIVQALSSIPGGGAIAAPIVRAMQQSQQYLQAEQVRMQTLPFLGGVGMQQAIVGAGQRAIPAAQRAGRRAAAAVKVPTIQATTQVGRLYLENQAREVLGLGPKPINEVETPPEVISMMERLGKTAVGRQMQSAAGADIAENIKDLRRRASEKAERKTIGAARARARRAFMEGADIQGLGAELMGVAAPEARQFAAGITQAGGGYGRELGQGRFLESAMAARTLFGVQAPTAGAFLRGGRRGGLVGGLGRGGPELRSALADAMRLGLEGSEINTYLQEMAAGINEWRQTGVPFNRQSIADMAQGMGQLGLGGVRGAAVAQGFRRAAIGVSREGPQTAAQLLMMQTMGGLNLQEMTPEAIEEAQIRMEKGEFGKGAETKFIETMLRATGGGALGRGRVRGALGGMGIQLGAEEMRLMGRRIEGALTPEDEERLQVLQEQRARGGAMAGIAETPEALAAAARRAVPPAVLRQAKLTNQQIATGRMMIKTVQTMEKTANRVTKEITGIMKPALEMFSIKVSDLTGALIENTNAALGGSASAVIIGPKT
jgi:hypothetical protein